MLKKLLLSLCIVFTFAYTDNNIPQSTISNGIISATLYMPDADNGYYRGTRFDWSGQISSLKYKRHSFFGQWFEKYDPYLHDAIMGPVEAFDPVGYEKAPTGGRFVKIGVGALEKPEEKGYFFANSYKLVNPGKWQIKKASDKIKFTHTLNDTSFSYVYTKTVELVKGKPQLILMHTLKNTGKKSIETNVMNHNFFVIDSLITSPDFELVFPFEPLVASSTEHKAATISGKRILLEDGDPKGKDFYLGPITGFSNNADDYNITVSNKKTGAAVSIKADKPFSKLAFWATVKTVCPEPFIQVKAEPGEEFSWKITYTFAVN
ncbi:MAG TPA: hypothetical protein VM101_11845 [Flavitalea sp.]|nr:hypothetical protein [Flavitalea sp.]